MFETVPTFHKRACLASPDEGNLVERESFSLKLTIENQDMETFKYLWDLNLWNVGHLIQCLLFLKEWPQGLKAFFGYKTTKILLLSVNRSAEAFVKVISEINKHYTKEVKECLEQRPYQIYLFFLEAINGRVNADIL